MNNQPKQQPTNLKPKITLKRHHQTITIPDGNPAILKKGEKVTIVQQLGETTTITTQNGTMHRLNKKDSIELKLTKPTTNKPPQNTYNETNIWKAASKIYDPEIPVNIVDLGLIYSIQSEQLEHGWHVKINMSVTAPFCGMGNILQQDLKTAVLEQPGVEQATVNLVFTPPWNSSMMTPAAKLELGFL